jgi:hypothetical protein
MPLNLNQLTARIAPSPDREDAARERIKGWTKKGILRGSAPGRGGVRKFNHIVILDAALLDTLVDHGLQPAAWDLRHALYVLRDAGAAWAAGDTRTRWLQLSLQPPLPDRPHTRGWAVALPLIAPGQKQPELIFAPGEEATIVVDLTAILKRLQWSSEDQTAVQADKVRRKL